jgi:Ala-tRNA(Pro) deacylase
MAIPITLREYLDSCGVSYEVIPHRYSSTSLDTAQAAGVSGETIAKSVVLEDDNGYVMAVIPATHHIELGQLGHQLHRHLGLATEQELSQLFSDCDLGAIPPVGQAYGMDVVLEDCLSDCSDIYFEAGDHTDLIHLRGEDFQRLMHNAKHGQFSRHL